MKAFGLYALGAADNERPRLHVGGDFPRHLPERSAGNGQEHDVACTDGDRHVAGRVHMAFQWKPLQVAPVLAVGAHVGQLFGIAHPEVSAMAVFRDDVRNGRTEVPGADDSRSHIDVLIPEAGYVSKRPP